VDQALEDQEIMGPLVQELLAKEITGVTELTLIMLEVAVAVLVQLEILDLEVRVAMGVQEQLLQFLELQ
jgi:hypothetical protein